MKRLKSSDINDLISTIKELSVLLEAEAKQKPADKSKLVRGVIDQVITWTKGFDTTDYISKSIIDTSDYISKSITAWHDFLKQDMLDQSKEEEDEELQDPLPTKYGIIQAIYKCPKQKQMVVVFSDRTSDRFNYETDVETSHPSSAYQGLIYVVLKKIFGANFKPVLLKMCYGNDQK